MEKDNKIRLFLDALPEEVRKAIPAPIFQIAEIGSSQVIIDKSASHHTDQLPCFWFYKPLSKMYKTFEG